MKQITKAVLAAAFGLMNIRGACGPGLDAPEATCLDARPAPAAETIMLGLMDGDTFSAITNDPSLSPEFGPQGGQHVWVAIEYYAQSETDWLHEFSLKDRSTGREIGRRSLVESTCAPGWNRIEMINVFVDDVVTSAAQIEVKSGPYDGVMGVTRTIEASADIQIVSP